jgi:SMP-30/Gluconolactonase/LRE-like region
MLKRLPILAVAMAALGAAAPAAAAPTACPGDSAKPKTLISGRGTLESVIVDRHGHLYFTDDTAGDLLRVARPGAKPKPVITGIDSPGGLVWDRGKLIVGYGDSVATASSTNPVAGLISYNPRTGKSHRLIAGTQMSNGLARSHDGAIYASSDVGTGIDRVLHGNVEINWASVASPNGLAVSPNGKWLYANQTFVPAQISRIEIADPSNVQTYVKLDSADVAAGLDGMTRDGKGRLYVAANGGNWVGRVNTDRSVCTLATGTGMTSAVALGHSTRGFSYRNLYAVNFGGELIELPRVR